MNYCRVCGSEIESGRNALYCSDLCRRFAEYRREHAERYFVDEYIREHDGMPPGGIKFHIPEDVYSSPVTDQERTFLRGLMERNRTDQVHLNDLLSKLAQKEEP